MCVVVIKYAMQKKARLILDDNDIFEDMFDLLKCEYLSDLHFKDIQVFQKLKTSNYENYTLLNLKDFFQYVFQIEIHSYEDIKKFLNQETMEETK